MGCCVSYENRNCCFNSNGNPSEKYQFENEETIANSSTVKQNNSALDKKSAPPPSNDSMASTLNASSQTKKSTGHQTLGTKLIDDSKSSPDDITATQIIDSTSVEKRHLLKTSSANRFNVSPDIFVSLKKGLISEFYKIGKTVGEGAYGKVYQVQHRTTSMIRAMKAIKKKSVVKEDQEKLFTEVNILKDLDHPNIIKLYELFQDENYFYLITEYCTGGELFDRIQSMHSFTEKMAADYMKQILSAIVYCHEKNIVHRDMKPENLLLDSTNPNARLKVIDFGTSKKFVDGAKMNQKFGTAYYIAPEVLSRNYDERCDVWSCGVILYILLCGYPPFSGANDKEILQKVKTGKYRFDDEDWAKISEDAKTLIKKMLAFNPADRLTAREALNDKWIQNNTVSQQISQKALKNLSEFSSRNKLKQAILTFIVTQMTSQKEKDELQKTFQSLDKDSNGILTKEELIEGYKKVYANRIDAEAEVIKIIEEVDINHSGFIDFTEFVIAAMNRENLLSKKKVEQSFLLFDQDNDGFITRAEVANMMGGIEIDDAEWKILLEDVDKNKDGKISQEEFMDLLTKL